MIDNSDDFLMNMSAYKKSSLDFLIDGSDISQQNQNKIYIEEIRPYYRRRDMELRNTVIRNRQFSR